MGVQSAVYVDDLSGHIAALIGSKVNAGVTDVLRATITVNHNITCEDVLEHLRHMRLVLRGDDEARTHAVAADVLLAVLGCC